MIGPLITDYRLSTTDCRERLEGIEHENARGRRDREYLGRVWTWELPEKALVMTTSIEERHRPPGSPRVDSFEYREYTSNRTPREGLRPFFTRPSEESRLRRGPNRPGRAKSQPQRESEISTFSVPPADTSTFALRSLNPGRDTVTVCLPGETATPLSRELTSSAVPTKRSST